MTNYKCIVTLTNGAHRIVRMTVDVMAKFITAFRERQRAPWLCKRYEEFFRSLELLPSQVKSLLFINEYTGERLSVA